VGYPLRIKKKEKIAEDGGGGLKERKIEPSETCTGSFRAKKIRESIQNEQDKSEAIGRLAGRTRRSNVKAQGGL